MKNVTFFVLMGYFILAASVILLGSCGEMFPNPVFGDVTFVNTSSTAITITVNGHDPFILETGKREKLTIDSESLKYDFSPPVRFEQSANGDNVYFILFD